MAARRRLIPKARPGGSSSVNLLFEVSFLLSLDWVIGVVSPVAVTWKMEVAGVVEFEVEVGRGTEIARREEVNTERADKEVVDWEEVGASELFSIDNKLVDDAEAVKVEVKIEVGMMSAVRLARTADRGSMSSVPVIVAAGEAAGEVMKVVRSVLARYANVRSVVSKHLSIVRTGQNLVRGTNPG